MSDALSKEELELLRGFIGTKSHELVLKILRDRLIGRIALFLSTGWDENVVRQIHTQCKDALELLTELRLDNIDVRLFSVEAVSQIETQMPTRVEYQRQMRGDPAL